MGWSEKKSGKETIRLICYIKFKIICFLAIVLMLPASLDPLSLGHGRDDASHQTEAPTMRHSSKPYPLVLSLPRSRSRRFRKFQWPTNFGQQVRAEANLAGLSPNARVAPTIA